MRLLARARRTAVRAVVQAVVQAVVIVCVLIGLVVTAPASEMPGSPVPIDLQWEAPQGCPQEGDVRSRIQKLLGAGRQDGPLRAEGTITRIDRRFRLELVVHVGDLVGTRKIESGSCEDLAGAAAVEIGLLLHSPKLALETDGSGNTPPTSTETAKAEATSETGTSAKADANAKGEGSAKVERDAGRPPPEVESQRAWHALVQAPLVALGMGPLPRIATGLGLSLGLEYARWKLQLNALSWQRQSVPAPGFPGYGVDVDRIGGALWACREYRVAWFGYSPCLMAGVERVSASGTGRNIAPTRRHMIAASAGAGVQGRVYLAYWIRLFAAVGGRVELSRPQLSISGLGPVYEFAPAALTSTLGLEWAW